VSDCVFLQLNEIRFEDMFGGKTKSDKKEKKERKEEKEKKKDKWKKDSASASEDDSIHSLSKTQNDGKLVQSSSSTEIPQLMTSTAPTTTNTSASAPITEQTFQQSQPSQLQHSQKASEDGEKKKHDEEKRRTDYERKKEEKERREKERALRKEEEEKRKEKERASNKKDSQPTSSLSSSTIPPIEYVDESLDAEVHSLETAKSDPNDPPTIYRDLYNLLPKDVFLSYDKLQNFARDLNTQIPTPEIIFIGKKSHGKSSLIESFFGETIGAVGSQGCNKRPLYINMINNLACTVPKYTIKRDAFLKEYDYDVEISLSELSNEIQKRNQVVSEEPLILQYEYSNCCNMTIIDTPGLLDQDERDCSKEEREQLIIRLSKPIHRWIICVEACRDWSKMEMLRFAKRIDPELSRTTFVCTKFQSLLQTLTSTREINKFLSGTLPDVKTFFTTMPTEGIRSKFREPEKYQQKIFQAYHRDMNSLEQLQYDKRYESFFGIHALRKHILNLAWKSYQEAIPRILKHLRAKKLDCERKIRELNEELESLNSRRLRTLASDYVVNFLKIIERLIAGTSEGNPLVNGQTLEEEKSSQGDGEWVDLYNRVIRFEPEEWNIPHWDNKVYGGQQFERLLAEYKAVSDHTEISEITMDDVATSAGINKLNNIPNYAWAASDLAQQKTQDTFIPLIEQLSRRAIYVMKRLMDIAEKMLENGSNSKSLENIDRDSHHFRVGNAFSKDIDRFPYFTYHVKDLYGKFVDTTAKMCKEKCMDEFYNTRTIYWDITSEYTDRNLPLERNDQEDTRVAVVKLTTDLFNQLRDRISKNVLLKFYNFFLVPMQHELWTEIQGKVNSLEDSSLEQIFEVSSTKDMLKSSIKELEEELLKCVENDKQFMQYAASFSKRI